MASHPLKAWEGRQVKGAPRGESGNQSRTGNQVRTVSGLPWALRPAVEPWPRELESILCRSDPVLCGQTQGGVGHLQSEAQRLKAHLKGSLSEGGTPGSAQRLLPAPCSGVTPGTVKQTMRWGINPGPGIGTLGLLRPPPSLPPSLSITPSSFSIYSSSFENQASWFLAFQGFNHLPGGLRIESFCLNRVGDPWGETVGLLGERAGRPKSVWWQ